MGVFDVVWSVLVSQLVAMLSLRSATRTRLIQHVLRHNRCLAILSGLSVLFFTHSLSMSLAIVFRAHEHHHSVPSVSQLVRTVFKWNPRRKAKKMLFFFFGWMIVIRAMERGSSINSHQELILASLNGTGLVLASRNVFSRKVGRPRQSWEASLIIFVGSIASLLWWAELFSPDSLNRLTPMRTFVVMLSVVTHVTLTAYFADAFRKRIVPPVSHCIYFTFWAGTMLFLGAKLEHFSAIEHQRHHSEYMTGWEILRHIGEVGLCEFGLISLMAWVTHLAANAADWLEAYEAVLHLPRPYLNQRLPSVEFRRHRSAYS